MTGFEMLMRQFIKLLPAETWERVHGAANVVASNVKELNDRLARIEADQREILRVLSARESGYPEGDENGARENGRGNIPHPVKQLLGGSAANGVAPAEHD